MIDCVKNILESIGEGDCKACICDIIPQFCQEKKIVSASKAKVLKAETSNQCGPDETSCPNGCCPEFNWYCCQDDHYCAATAAGCPFLATKKTQLIKLAKTKRKQCGPDETSCPNAMDAARNQIGHAVLLITVLQLLKTA